MSRGKTGGSSSIAPGSVDTAELADDAVTLAKMDEEARPPMTNVAPNPYCCQNTVQGSSKASLTAAGNTSYSDGWKMQSENADVDWAKQTSGGPTSDSFLPFTKCHQKLTKKTNAGKLFTSMWIPKEQSDMAKDWNVVGIQVWLKSSAAATFRMGLIQNSNAADTIPDPMVSAFGGAGTDPTLSAGLAYSLSAPSDVALSAGAWTKVLISTANNDGTENDGIAIFSDDQMAVNDTLEIAAPMYVRGGSVRAFNAPPAGATDQEMARQYQKSFSNDTTPGTATTVGAVSAPVILGNGDELYIPFKTEMLKIPTVTIYSADTGVASKVYDGSGDVDAGAVNINQHGFTMQVTAAVGGTGPYQFHWVADGGI